MILPTGASSFKEAMKMGVEVYHNLKVIALAILNSMIIMYLYQHPPPRSTLKRCLIIYVYFCSPSSRRSMDKMPLMLVMRVALLLTFRYAAALII